MTQETFPMIVGGEETLNECVFFVGRCPTLYN